MPLDDTPMITELEKYTRAWEDPDYRRWSPGEQAIPDFLRVVRPRPKSTIVDLGCGPGRASDWLQGFGFDVVAIDLAPNCLDVDVAERVQLVQLDVTRDKLPESDYVFCCDVLEHLPPDRVDFALTNILSSCEVAFLVISYLDDHFGEKLGHPLHLTVRSHAWWRQRIEKLGFKVIADVDKGDRGSIVAGANKHQINNSGRNIRNNVTAALARGLPHVTLQRAQPDTELMLIGGGPSTEDLLDEIRRNVEDGIQAVALNGAHDFLLDHGIIPGAMILMDTRPLNRRFVERAHPRCRYLISSGCDPSVFDVLVRTEAEVLVWHANNRWVHSALVELGYGKRLFPIEGMPIDDVAVIQNPADPLDYQLVFGGGSTVALRAVHLLYALGFRKLIAYGLDSCYVRGRHHSYEQDENFTLNLGTVRTNGRDFITSFWMQEQANEFMRYVKEWPDDLLIDVRGDGLIAHFIRSESGVLETPTTEE